MINPREALLPTGWIQSWTFEWTAAFKQSIHYLPIVIPFALATVIGGIDCTESAAAAGDEYDTRAVIGVEGFATLLAALCGGVIQTTPYIGHPAYKAMGGRAAYTLATALFVGSAGVLGYFAYMYMIIPKAAIFPILIFIGLEITSQSFHATPRRHFPALALACVPAMAQLVMIFLRTTQVAHTHEAIDALPPGVKEPVTTVRMLASGFIVTSLMWAGALAAIIDRRLRRAAVFFGICGVCSLFGIMHSPVDGEKMVLPWDLPAEIPEAASGQSPVMLFAAYLLVSLLLYGWWAIVRPDPLPESEDAATHA